MQLLRLAAAAAAGGVHAQTFTSVEVEARTFHLGAFELSAIRDNALKYKSATVFGKDTDPAEVAKVAHVADEHLLIFTPHFPFPGVGRVERAGDGFVFKPEVPAQ